MLVAPDSVCGGSDAAGDEDRSLIGRECGSYFGSVSREVKR